MPARAKRSTRTPKSAPALLTGRHARLRPLRADDREQSVRWRNDPEVRDNILGYRFPVTEAMEANWVDAVLNDQSRTRVLFAIEDQTDGALVGFVYLSDIDWFSRVAEFGILIGDQSRQGKGLGREALDLMARYAFEDLNLNRLHLRVAAFNKRAVTLYRSFGFTQEGVLRRHAFVRGRYHDVVLFGLLRAEHAKRQPR